VTAEAKRVEKKRRTKFGADAVCEQGGLGDTQKPLGKFWEARRLSCGPPAVYGNGRRCSSVMLIWRMTEGSRNRVYQT
jgi:hypothetical protein